MFPKSMFSYCVINACLISFSQFGPVNPFKSQQMAAPRNMLSGYAEPAHLNDFMFEQQRRTFSTYGKLICDPCGGFKSCGQCIPIPPFYPDF